jgi:hypothetical protein
MSLIYSHPSLPLATILVQGLVNYNFSSGADWGFSLPFASDSLGGKDSTSVLGST